MHGWFACKGFASRTEQTSPTHSQLYYICVNIYVTFAGASTVSTVSAAAWEGERGTRPHYVPTLPQNTQFGACSENFLISLELHSLNGSVAGWQRGWEYAASRTTHNCSSPSSSELQYYLVVRCPSTPPQQLAAGWLGWS